MKLRIGDQMITKDPDLRTLLREAGISDDNRYKRILASFLKDGIEPNQIHSMDIDRLSRMDGITLVIARKIYAHARLIRMGQPVIMSTAQLRELESRFDYLPSSSGSINRMLTYANGRTGLRSATLTELYGEASSGKTQICYTMAIMCLKNWDRAVLYIDSEGSLDLTRFMYMARYWGLSEDKVNKLLSVAKVRSFDDVEDAVHASTRIDNVGMIIVDSIMDPLKSQYPIAGEDLNNLQPRQQHLKRVTDQLKSIAQISNSICIYTNHIRASFGEVPSATVAQGGNVLAHASDIRIELSLVSNKKLEGTGLKLSRAVIVDSGFLPNAAGEFLIGPMGIADPAETDKMIEHAKLIEKRGFICVDSFGNNIEPLVKEHGKRDKSLQEMKKELYNVN